MVYKRFPFSAIVGQDKLKNAYLSNIINPKIGGLLVSGPKGTGKSTVVRSIDSVLPDYDAVDGCIFDCDPDHPEAFCSLCQVRISDELIKGVASFCAELKVDGQRPDIVIIKTALTLAALNGRPEALPEDIELSAELALIHRTRDGGLLEPPALEEIAKAFIKHIPQYKKSYEESYEDTKKEQKIGSDTTADAKKRIINRR